MVVNDLLQLKLEDAFVNSGRFLFNSTIGLAGIFDPASSIDLYARDTDSGETLHVWGVGEGAYLEVPVLGPSTERDLVGTVVDFAMNPTRVLATGDLSAANTAADIGAQVGDRYEYSDLVDEVLYESADSYAQARLLYLQNRRFELNAGEEPEYLDPYEDLYAE
jgi:phospholipid-binding lipoprotein MlaA